MKFYFKYLLTKSQGMATSEKRVATVVTVKTKERIELYQTTRCWWTVK